MTDLTFQDMQIIASLCGAVFWLLMALHEDRAVGLFLYSTMCILHAALAAAVVLNV